MRNPFATFLVVSALALVLTSTAAADRRLAPLPKEEATSTHGPFEAGACDTCHERSDPKNPGAAVKASNDLCFECHDEFRGTAPIKMDRKVHPSGKSNCMGCHSPHNSRKRKLLL